MSKFYVGQKVLVMGNSYYSDVKGDNRGSDLIGKICKVKCDVEGRYISIFTPDEKDWWYVNKSDLQPITETPETLTINGVEYIRKPEPEHEWKFGDVAVHEVYGVGIVCGRGSEIEFHHDNGEDYNYVPASSLTFLRRTDFSV